MAENPTHHQCPSHTELEMAIRAISVQHSEIAEQNKEILEALIGSLKSRGWITQLNEIAETVNSIDAKFIKADVVHRIESLEESCGSHAEKLANVASAIEKLQPWFTAFRWATVAFSSATIVLVAGFLWKVATGLIKAYA
jgi:chromosome segregation ATPase